MMIYMKKCNLVIFFAKDKKYLQIHNKYTSIYSLIKVITDLQFYSSFV